MSPRRLAHTPVALALSLSACAGAGGPPDDPYEPYNRWVHRTNLGLDRYAVRPVAQAYDAATPAVIQHMLANAFSHVDSVTDVANYLLQGRPDPALRGLGRLTLNTVLGAGGLLDPATEFGLPKEDTDLGTTLAEYGVPEGPFWMVLLLGPATTRDFVGQTVDLAMNPLTWVGFAIDRPWLQPAVDLAEYVDYRAGNMALLDDLLYGSEDSYVTLRTTYLQNRAAVVAGGQAVIEDLPDIFEEEGR